MKRRNPLNPIGAEVVANANIALWRSKSALEKTIGGEEQWGGEHAAARQKVSDAQGVLERAIRAQDSATLEGA